MHASIVLSQDPIEYAALFGEIADAYFEREIYAEAGHIYEMLGADATVSIPSPPPYKSLSKPVTDEQSAGAPPGSCMSAHGGRFERGGRGV